MRTSRQLAVKLKGKMDKRESYLKAKNSERLATIETKWRQKRMNALTKVS